MARDRRRFVTQICIIHSDSDTDTLQPSTRNLLEVEVLVSATVLSSFSPDTYLVLFLEQPYW